MLRIYAYLVGAGLFVVVAAGLFGTWDITPTKEIIYADYLLYLVTAAIFFYVSFARSRAKEIRYVVGGIGLLYLLSGVFVVAGLLLFVLSFEAYELGYNLMRAAFGALSIFAASFLSCADDYSEPS
jgi:hypothetical protein